MKAAGEPRLAAGLLSVGVVLAALIGLRSLKVLPQAGGALFALGFLILAGTVAGRLAAAVRLPRLTGYLLAGVLAGPHGFALFGKSAVSGLSLINGLALALIALLAGAEMTLPVLRRTWRSVLWSSAAQVLLVALPMAGIFFLLAPRMDFTAGMTAAGVLALGGVWGVIALSRSPSVTLGILSETKAKGPVAEHALGVVVLLDVLVLALFSFAMAMARTAIVGAPVEIHQLVHLGKELFASVAAGTTFGLLIALYFRFAKSERILFLVGVSYGITAFTAYFQYDTLLVFVVAGFVVMNLTRLGHDLVAASEQLSGAVMVVFFATAGAKIDLSALRTLWPVALALVILRIALTFVSARAGHRLARDPPVVRRYAYLSLVSQAGVTIGLSTIVSDSLPGVGPALATLAIAVVGVNELIGPICFKYALSRADEIPTEQPSTAPTQLSDAPRENGVS